MARAAPDRVPAARQTQPGSMQSSPPGTGVGPLLIDCSPVMFASGCRPGKPRAPILGEVW